MRLKDVVDLINAKTDCVDRPYVALENIVSWDAKFVASDAATEGTNACFKAGDVLFGKLRPYLAKGYLPDYDGICSTEFLVMRPHDDMNGRYLLYWLLSPEFISVIKNRVAGVKMPRTDWATVSQMELTPPTLTAQRHIVAYLDEKTAAIDSRVAVLERKLAAYKRIKASVINRAVTRGLDPKAKLKDSGIDWIGQIPAGWAVDKIGNCFDLIGSGTTPRTGSQDLYEGDIPWVQSGDLHGDWVTETSKCVNETALEIYFLPVYKAPFICVAMYGASIGNVSTIGVDACTNQACCALCKPRPEIHLGYMFYLLRQSQQRLLLFAEGATQPNINRGTITGLRVGFPSLAEQRAIADYLDAECAKIDKMAKLVTREIELYRKLKRSLINEVVTGKREVA